MRRIYKISLNIIGIILIFLLMISASYMKYLKTVGSDSSLVLVEDGLSINYLNGNKIDTNGEEENYTISVTNNSENTLYYYIQVNNVVSDKENPKYNLVEKNNKLNILEEEFPITESYIASFIEIGPNNTHTFSMTILENSHSSLKANIKIGLEDIKEDNFAATILANNEIKKSAITKVGEEAATTNEGLIEISDDGGNSYYFRGAVDNNYVNFANLTWRIIKINGDGSIKLILNDYTGETANFYSAENTDTLENKLNFSNSIINNILTSWYQTNLNGYEKYIASSKYCIDDSIGEISDSNTYYLGYSRLLIDYNQVNSCLGSKYNSKIGLITADEAVFAGASKNAENKLFYLYTPDSEQAWWTMTPASNDGTNIAYFEIGTDGILKGESFGNYYRGVKPVINLIKKTYVSGSGTFDDPYIIKE